MDLILNGTIPISGNRFRMEKDLMCLTSLLKKEGFEVYITRKKEVFREGGVVLSSLNQRGLETNLRQIFYSPDWLLPYKFNYFAKPLINERKSIDVLAPNFFNFSEIDRILDAKFRSCSFSKITKEIKNHKSVQYKEEIWDYICLAKLVLIYGDNWHSLFEANWLRCKCVFLNCPKIMGYMSPLVEVRSSYDLETALSSDIPMCEIPGEIIKSFSSSMENLINGCKQHS